MIMSFGFVSEIPRINVANVYTVHSLQISAHLQLFDMSNEQTIVQNYNWISHLCYAFRMECKAFAKTMDENASDDDRSEKNGRNDFTGWQF